MQYIKLNNGHQIPQLGFGAMVRLPGDVPDKERTEQAVAWALEAGYRHIDTATIYGTEREVGISIKASGVPREEIFLTTKLWNEDIRQGRAKEGFAASLAALQTDYVDLYLLHWPVDGFEKAWAELVEFYKAGKARAIGVSNFQKRHLERLAEVSDIVPAVNQIESNPQFNNQELIDYCHSKGIAIEAWSPLGGSGGTLLQNETLRELGEKYGKTPTQIVVRWDLQRGIIVLPKSAHKDRIASNLQVFDFELSAQDMARMQSLNTNVRTGPDPDNFNF